MWFSFWVFFVFGIFFLEKLFLEGLGGEVEFYKRFIEGDFSVSVGIRIIVVGGVMMFCWC